MIPSFIHSSGSMRITFFSPGPTCHSFKPNITLWLALLVHELCDYRATSIHHNKITESWTKHMNLPRIGATECWKSSRSHSLTSSWLSVSSSWLSVSSCNFPTANHSITTGHCFHRQCVQAGSWDLRTAPVAPCPTPTWKAASELHLVQPAGGGRQTGLLSWPPSSLAWKFPINHVLGLSSSGLH